MGRLRVMLGFAAAPLVVISPIVSSEATSLMNAAPDERLAIAASLATTLAMAYGPALLIGLPIHLLLERQGKRDLPSYLLATALGSPLVPALAAVFDKLIFPSSREENPFGMTMWSQFGVLLAIGFVAASCFTAALFWSIAVRPVPDERPPRARQRQK